MQIKMRLDNLIYTVDRDDVLEIERLANLGAVEYNEDVEEVDQANENEDEPKKEKKSSKK